MDIVDKQEQFLELFEDCREGLVRFARAMTRNAEDAKDLVQETTLAAYEGFEKLKNPAAFKSFLFTIASRIFKRQNWRKRLFFKFSGDDAEELFFESLVDANQDAGKRYDIEALHNALKLLSDKYREAVILFEIIGLKMEEIAEIQKCSISGAKSRVQRARAELEEILIKNKVPNKNKKNNYSGNITDEIEQLTKKYQAQKAEAENEKR